MQTNAPGLGKVTLTYIAYYLGIAVVINVILFAAEYFAGFAIQPSAVGWLPLILGAMMAGQFYGAKTGGKPTQGFAWLAGFCFMVVSVILSVAILYLAAKVMGFDMGLSVQQLRAEMGDDGPLIAGLLGVVLLIIWVGQRFMFSTGAKQGAIQAAARAK
jgi:hypothetical protein